MIKIWILLCYMQSVLAVFVHENKTNEYVAGISNQIEVYLNVENEALANSEIHVNLTFYTNGDGCAPSAMDETACEKSTQFEFSNVAVVDNTKVMLNVLLAEKIDFSLVNQYLLVSVSCENENGITSTSGSPVQVSGEITGIAPNVQVVPVSLVAGKPGDNIVEMTGNGFSRYPSKMELLLRAKTEHVDLTKPYPVITASTATEMTVHLKTSCDGKDLTLLDTGLVGNRIQLANLKVIPSGKQYSNFVDMTENIGGGTLQVTSASIIAFGENEVTIVGKQFSCNPNASVVNFYTNTGVGVMPKATVTIASPTSITLKLNSCDGKIDGLDTSVSGSIMMASVTIKSVVQQVSEKVKISNVITAPLPTISVNVNHSIEAGVIDEQIVTVDGTGFSCDPNFNLIQVSSLSSITHPPVLTMVSGSSTSLKATFTSCDGAFRGVDPSATGATLTAKVVVQSVTQQETEAVIISNEITGAAPTMDLSKVVLTTDELQEPILLEMTRMSCYVSENKVQDLAPVPESSFLKLPTMMIQQVNLTHGTIDFLSCSDRALDASMVGFTMKMSVAVQSPSSLATDVLVFPSAATGNPPSISTLPNIDAGSKFIELRGSGFSCDPRLNRIEFKVNGKLDDSIEFKIIESSKHRLYLEIITTKDDVAFDGFNHGMIGSDISTSVQVGTRENGASLGTIQGQEPSILVSDIPTLRICVHEHEEFEFNLTVFGLPDEKSAVQAKIFQNDRPSAATIRITSILPTNTTTKIVHFQLFELPKPVDAESIDTSNFTLSLSVPSTNQTSNLIQLGAQGDCISRANFPYWAIVLVVIAIIVIVGGIVYYFHVRHLKLEESNAVPSSHQAHAPQTYDDVMSAQAPSTPRGKIPTI